MWIEGEREQAEVVEAGIPLAPGSVPPGHVHAVRALLFTHGRTIAATAARHAAAVRLVAPTARWPAAPLLLLRCLAADRVVYTPVDADGDALAVAARRAGLAHPGVVVEPCRAPAQLVLPFDALAGPERRILFLPWWPDPSGEAARRALAEAARALRPDGCVLAGVPGARADAVTAGAWPAGLKPIGAWIDGHGAARLVLLEAGTRAAGP